MPHTTVIIEQTFKVPASAIWKALTNTNEMKQWYFNIDNFHLEPGYEFQFTAGSSEKQYLHLCEIVEAVPEKKLSYTWRYDGLKGSSLLTFKIAQQDNKTYLKLTHTDLDSFAENGSDFSITSFNEGWNHFINTNLKNYLENSHNND